MRDYLIFSSGNRHRMPPPTDTFGTTLAKYTQATMMLVECIPAGKLTNF
jgi:hypothetical protein